MTERTEQTGILELPKTDFAASYEVMRELRPYLTKEVYVARANEMRARGYRLLALKINGDVAVLAGVIFDLNLYWGRHLFVYDLVTAEKYRLQGYGKRMLGHIHTLAREEDCEAVALSSGFPREGAHRFYEREGYERTDYVFLKRLADV